MWRTIPVEPNEGIIFYWFIPDASAQDGAFILAAA
jgi:hypothetical protein